MLNPATDWKKFILMGNRAIKITSVRTSNPPSVQYDVPYSQRGKCSYRMIQATNGALVRPEAMYLVPKHADNTNGAGPWKPGDLLEDAAEQDPTQQTPTPVIYTVQVAESDDYYWLLAVFNPKICFNLRDLVNIQVATDSLTTVLTRSSSFTTETANAVCRRQPSSVELKMLHGRQADSRMFDVFFAANHNLQPKKHVLSWTEGSDTVIADIIRVDQSERIDVPMRAVVEVRA